MSASFLATWTQLRRPAMLYGTYGALAALGALITSVIFLNAQSTPGEPGGAGPDRLRVTLQSLSQAGGLLEGLGNATSILGVVAVCVAAAAIAGQYSTGTLRNLLIRRPNRLRLLAGIWAGVTTFVLGAVLVAAVVSAAAALLLAGVRDIDTTAWFSADGWSTSARTIGLSLLATAGYATIGAVLGSLLRASVPAVAIAVAWLLPLEGILSGVIDGSDRWLPGRLLGAIATDGAGSVTLTAALLTVGVYLLAAGTLTGALFARRDVTA
jgi:hypothetical protein